MKLKRKIEITFEKSERLVVKRRSRITVAGCPEGGIELRMPGQVETAHTRLQKSTAPRTEIEKE